MNGRFFGRLPVLLCATAIVLIDQISKIWITSTLTLGRTIKALPGLLDLHLVHNTGAAFSLLSGATPILGLLSLIVSIVVLIWLSRQQRIPFWLGLAVASLLGGTLGNGLDRWRLGYVIDFLDLVPINFPIFNVADIAINFALICFVLNAMTSREASRRG